MKTFMNLLQRFKINEGGIAAVEFAVILPVLALLVFGGFGTFQAIKADRSIARTSSIVSDLISRMSEIDDDTANNLEAIAKSLIGELADDPSYQITMSSIYNEFDTKDKYDLVVDWSYSNRPSKKLKDGQIQDYTIPLIPEGETVILVHVALEYDPLLFDNYAGKITLAQSSTRRPRFVPLVKQK